MPYEIQSRDGKFVVMNPESGKVYGEHDSEEGARAQQKALYANAPPSEEEAKKGDMPAWPPAKDATTKWPR